MMTPREVRTPQSYYALAPVKTFYYCFLTKNLMFQKTAINYFDQLGKGVLAQMGSDRSLTPIGNIEESLFDKQPSLMFSLKCRVHFENKVCH